jgi:hypothetical protein
MEQQTEHFNPWLNIWTRPRETIQQIMEKNPNHRLAVLFFIYGFPWLLSIAQSFSLGRFYSAWMIGVIALILSIPAGYALISISSFFFLWIGKLIRGRGNFHTIRSAIAWANVPHIVSVLFWIMLIILFSDTSFHSDFAKSSGYAGFIMSAYFIQFIFTVWAFILFLHTLGQVQGFSAWMSLLNAILVGIVYVIIIFAGSWLLRLGNTNIS